MRKDRKVKSSVKRVPRNEKAKKLLYFQERFSVFIKDIRGTLSQQELAEELSKYTPAENTISQTSISSYENCETLPSLDTFFAIREFSGLSSDEILEIIFNKRE